MTRMIHVSSTTIEDKMLKSCFQVIAAFFPGAKIDNQEGTPADITISIEIASQDVAMGCDAIFRIRITDTRNNRDYVCRQKAELGKDFTDELIAKRLPGKEPLLQILLKGSLCKALTDYTGITLPWGILTGIRPGKLIEKMNDRNYPDELKEKVLRDLYLMQRKKIELLNQIASIQKPFLINMKKRPDIAAIYLAIPFCPSRCFYCSFPSNSIQEDKCKRNGINNVKLCRYLDALRQEIHLTGDMMRRSGLKADSIYIGGGTPTVLDSVQLDSLLQTIRDLLPIETQAEFTVEAGRPDTIDRDKLMTMKNHGVNRISINPQTMQDATLAKIGRRHTAQAAEETLALARSISDWAINMDLILGLPGEGRQEVTDTLEKVMKLRPDNITVHSLALKRGSAAWESHYLHDQAEEWESIQEGLAHSLARAGYVPYYLYKQKYSVGNLENIGYALPGKACRYNIAVIEERQNIIGLGACSSSKIFRQSGIHENIYHPIDLMCYEQQLDSVHHKISQAVSEYIGFK